MELKHLILRRQVGVSEREIIMPIEYAMMLQIAFRFVHSRFGRRLVVRNAFWQIP